MWQTVQRGILSKQSFQEVVGSKQTPKLLLNIGQMYRGKKISENFSIKQTQLFEIGKSWLKMPPTLFRFQNSWVFWWKNLSETFFPLYILQCSKVWCFFKPTTSWNFFAQYSSLNFFTFIKTLFSIKLFFGSRFFLYLLIKHINTPFCAN